MSDGKKQSKPITTGLVTFPAESGQEELTAQLVKKWGADAIRNSDGTLLSPEIAAMDYKIYTTICLARAEQSWPKAHRDSPP